MKPATRYAKSGSINIAYQVFGTGSIDLVYIPGWVSNIDLMWACPSLSYFLKELGKICRVILFDKRGTGLSDRISELSTLEERMDDLRAVMDAVGSEKSILFGHSEGGSVSALFAATYPQRTISLIAFGIFAKRRYSPDYPWAPTDQQRQKVYDMIENSWGSGDMELETLAPSRADDTQFMDWLAQYFRSGASPSAAMVLTRMNTLVDIVDILGMVRVPTLIMQRRQDIDVKIEEGRFISEKIPDSTLVEMEGSDHLFWAGDSQEVLDCMKAFILQNQVHPHGDKRLTAVLVAKIRRENPTSSPEGSFRQAISKFRGKLSHLDEERLVATFEGPSKAVHCGLELMDLATNPQRGLAICIHMLETASEEPVANWGEAQAWTDAMWEQGLPGQLLITQTAKHLLAGTGLTISPSLHTLKTTNWQPQALFRVTDGIASATGSSQHGTSWSESFLEGVIQCIHTHLDNEQFGLNMLADELSMSGRQLQRKLKAVSNKSPSQLISSVRLHRAKELLLSQKYVVSEIAFLTGFSNPSYFSKCFKKEFGISPSSLISQY
ncbi:alpha/beta fold hydrolase [Algoriphagus sp. H41]|uniref:Alpha/beta fold hydrolase n=1 Tax=Algoriphagus oliviformis TaxID=2811231 RepID=A0ABS3CD77_9BACT|nr:alpha/beta fold hydrolase [Algoriphagus oliviformis]MBN7813594.1 alpha/beta fold hydrolase [Algoriphagus oliviformis]